MPPKMPTTQAQTPTQAQLPVFMSAQHQNNEQGLLRQSPMH